MKTLTPIQRHLKIHEKWKAAHKANPMAPGLIKFFDLTPRESTLERWGCNLVKKCGGHAYKFVSPGHRSVPDRMNVFPYGHVFFIEYKRKGKKATPKQITEHRNLLNYGFAVYVCDSKEQVMATLRAEGCLNANIKFRK